MQLNIISATTSDAKGDFRTAYPVNLVPIPKQNGISNGYLRSMFGITPFGSVYTGGTDRGGVNWNNILYRVVGSKLVRVNADMSVDILGDVDTDGLPVSFAYSFDRLAIQSTKKLYYFKDGVLLQVTDPDLGDCLDVIWEDGYFISTDGTYIVVTELNDPTSIDPLKYGSSEADPDPIVGLLKLRNELYALNRYTIEVFDDVGGTGFPFQRVDGAIIAKGLVGKDAKAVLGSSFVFMGSSANESVSIYISSGGGNAQSICSREIDEVILGYTEAELATVNIEYHRDRQSQYVIVHFPREVWAHDLAASQVVGEPVWFKLTSGVNMELPYRAQNFTFCYDQFICGDKIDSRLGSLDLVTPTQYGDIVGWEFLVGILYNESKSFQVYEIELVCLPGREPDPKMNPKIFMSHSDNGGLTWSDEKIVSVGKQGQYNKRVVWRPRNFFRNYRIYKFRGATEGNMAFARIEARGEPLAW